eukprot:15344140-Ditylum_brightwellii.AAC.1
MKFIVLLYKLGETLKAKRVVKGGSDDKKPGETVTDNDKRKGGWKYCNPDKLDTMERNSQTWRWFTNNCHLHEIWCP